MNRLKVSTLFILGAIAPFASASVHIQPNSYGINIANLSASSASYFNGNSVWDVNAQAGNDISESQSISDGGNPTTNVVQTFEENASFATYNGDGSTKSVTMHSASYANCYAAQYGNALMSVSDALAEGYVRDYFLLDTPTDISINRTVTSYTAAYQLYGSPSLSFDNIVRFRQYDKYGNVSYVSDLPTGDGVYDLGVWQPGIYSIANAAVTYASASASAPSPVGYSFAGTYGRTDLNSTVNFTSVRSVPAPSAAIMMIASLIYKRRARRRN